MKTKPENLNNDAAFAAAARAAAVDAAHYAAHYAAVARLEPK